MVAMNAPINHNGEVTTLAALAANGLLRFTTGFHDGPKRNGERKTVRHFRAELLDGSGFWDISRKAYESRTGVKIPDEPPPAKYSPFVAKDSGTPWLSSGY